MALYEKLTATSTPEEIAAAYREYTGLVGGDTQEAQERAVNYLSNLGISAPTITQAYNQFLQPAALDLAQIANTSGVGAQGIGVTSSPVGALSQAIAQAPTVSFTPGLANQTIDQKAAEYNNLLGQGFTDAQIRAAADATFGTQSASDWSALTSLAGKNTAAADAADVGLKSNVITDYRGKDYDTATVTNLANQLAGIADTSQFSGGVFGTTKGSVGFDYDQVSRALGRDVSTAEQVLFDSARSLIDQGITDLSKLGMGDIKSTVTVQQEYNDNGEPTGNFVAYIPSGMDSEGNTAYATRILTPAEAAKIRTEQVTNPGDDSGPFTRRLLDDVVTGRGVVYDGKGRVAGNVLEAGSTYTGKGGTAYQITYDENGKPRFTTTGFSTSDMDTIAPLLQIASFIPGAQPFVLAANAAIAADRGDVFGALASLAGMGGPSNFATGLNIANAIDKKDIGALTGALLNNSSFKDVAGSTMLTDSISLADLGNAANVVANLDNKNWVGALNAAAPLTGSSDVKVAAAAATIISELASGNPNVGAIINASQSITNATSAATRSVDANMVGGITNRILDDMTDGGAAVFADAKRAGASDADALAASNALTRIAEANETFDGSGFATQQEAMNAAIDAGLDKFTFGGKKFTIDNSAAQIADFEKSVKDDMNLRAASTTEWGDLAGAQAAATARNTVSIGNAEANDVNEAAYLAKVRDPSATSFTFDGKTYNISASNAEMAQATRNAALAEIRDLPNFRDAYAQARTLLGPNQTFTWNGKEYSTATAQERPDLSAPKVQAPTDESAAETARLNRQNTALVTGNAPDQSAAETARLTGQNAYLKSMEKTGFLGQLYKDLNEQFRLQGVAANEYLQNNPDSPITASVSSAFDALGDLQRGAGGIALAFDNKPLADAIISGGDKIQKLGQSLGSAPEDTKNWNDTLALIDKAKGTEKLAVLAGRIMDGKSGLARQVGLELRQELPALFMGGGLLRPTMIASGMVDTADTAGNAIVEAYDEVIRNKGSHQEGLSAGRKAGAAAGATEAAIQLTFGKLGEVAAGKLDNLIAKGTTKVVGEGAVEAAQEGGSSAAVDLALGRAIDVNKALTQTVVGGAVGKGTATATSPVDAAQTITQVNTTASSNISNNISTAINSGNTQNIAPVITESVTSSLNSGADVNVVVDSAITSAINSGADPSVAIDSTITSAVDAGASVDLTIGAAVSSAVNAGADANTVVQAATNAATATGNSVNIALDANMVTISNATTNANTTVNTATGVTTTVDNNTNTTTVVDGNTTTVVDANTNTTSQTKVDGNTQTTVTSDANTNTNTQTVVDASTNTTTSITVNTNNNNTTQTTISGDTQTTVLTDPTTNTQTTVVINANTGDVIDVKEGDIPPDWTPPVIEAPSVPGIPTATPAATEIAEDPAKKAARLRLPQRGGAAGVGGAGLPSGIDVSGEALRSRVTQGQIDPLARVKEAQAELERDVMMNQIDPRLLSVMQQRMGIDQPNPQQQFESDIGALARMLRGEPEAPANENKYYSYGSEDSIDDILGGKAANYAAGGYVEPLKASGGSMALPLLAKSGGALDKYHGRENFKQGKHVAGEGDGQSDDIPAWLADGEFVFPADVVSALGNGSTKAGTDKLYEMMHNIRERARSKGPKDLPPPAFKSPLDYLKSSKRSTK